MKRILTILILALSLHLSAQEWSPIGAKWQFSINSFWITGYLEIECIGDTSIGNTTYRVLNKTYHLYNYLNQTFSTDTIGQEFTYQDGEKVFILRNNQLYMLFDFGAQVGDWWLIPQTFPTYSCDTIGYVQVDSLGLININDWDLKQIYVSPRNESHWGWGPQGYDVLTEKIGSLSLYLLPELTPNCMIADLFEGGPFRCYEDYEIGLYSVLTQGYCDSIHTGIIEYQQQDVVSAYPNPFTTSTTIEYELTEPSHVQLTIYNAIGETIHMAVDRIIPLGKHSFAWNAEGLPEGFYYVVLRSEEGVEVVKMIKQ